jgi:hypothetical protein
VDFTDNAYFNNGALTPLAIRQSIKLLVKNNILTKQQIRDLFLDVDVLIPVNVINDILDKDNIEEET